MESKSTGRIKKYGVCLNDKCEKYKQIQEIMHGDLECPECKKKLSPCAPPKQKKSNMPIFISVFAVVAIGAVAASLYLWNKNDSFEDEIPTTKQEIVTEPELPVDDEEPIVDVQEEIVIDPAPVEEVKPVAAAPSQVSSRNKDLGYATWKGALKNGQPNDENGTMTYKESHRIDSRDSQARVAEPGDYIIGEYVDGKLVQGIWYDKTNTVKGSIIIGR